MFYSDHGVFFDGDIHHAQDGMDKWAMEHSQQKISENVRHHRTFAFTCVRNPYTRILSSFFDKICGIQRNGNRYRGKLVPLLLQEYGVEVGGEDGKEDFDQTKSFRRFFFLPVIPLNFVNRWSQIFTGRQCQAISLLSL